MAKIMNVGILFLFLAIAAVKPLTADAAEHLVQWIIPSPTAAATFYSTSLANTTFKLNDVIVFNFASGYHNVVTLSKKDYEDCNVKAKMETFNTSPARIKLSRAGEFYFACAFTAHCSLGQKLSVNVATASSPSPSPAVVAPAEAPSSPAAGSLTATTFSVLIIAFAINVMF